MVGWGSGAGAAPTRRGFGSRLLQSGVAAELGGKVAMNFPPEGLVCVITAPLSDKIALAPLAAA